MTGGSRPIYTTRQGKHRAVVSQLWGIGELAKPFLVACQVHRADGAWVTVDSQRCERAGLAESIADGWTAAGGVEL